MNEESTGRDWILWLVLCVVGFGLGRVQNAERSGNQRSDVVSNTIKSAVLPSSLSLGTGLESVGNFWSGVTQSGRYKSENDALRAQVAQLQMYRLEADQYAAQVTQLRSMIELPDLPGKQRIFGQIIDYAPHENRITIAAGRKQGVAPNLPVISAQGLIGRIDLVDETTSQALLITSPQLSIGAKIPRNPPVAGLIRGENPNTLVLTIVENTKIDIGDPVVTSGYATLMPPGIKIGEVIEVSETTGYGTSIIKVLPSFRLALNQEVTILR